MREIISGAKVVKALANAAITADTDGANIDCDGAVGVLVLVNVGVTAGPADATNYWKLKLYDSDDDGSGSPASYGAVDSAYMKGAGVTAGGSDGKFALIDDATEDDAVYAVAYTGGKRWLRVTCDATLSPGSTPIGATAILYPLRDSSNANG